MPTYEFRCPDGTIIERMFRISEVPQEIPVPNGEGMATRIISGGASLLFKGSGFYITDYGKDGKKDQRAAAGGEKSGERSSGESKSGESKSGDSKSSDSKSSESKPSESKSSADTKTVSTPASTKSESKSEG